MGTVAEAVNYFECRIPESNLRIRIDLDLIERMTLDVVEGFKKVPKRGLEVGGLLLGRLEADCTVVEAFEALDSEHQGGPSFLLSEKDKRRLSEAVARCNAGERRVVGLYRSHTRPGLAPVENDEVLMKEHCPFPSGVLLLVKPEAGRRCAALLFGSGGGLHGQPAEFPFDRGVLTSGGFPIVEAPGPVERVADPEGQPAPRLRGAKLMHAMTRQLERAGESPPQGVVVMRPYVRQRRLAIALGAFVVLCGGAAGYSAARWWTRAPAAELTQAKPKARPAAFAGEKSLALNVTWGAGVLHLRWDREAELIRIASRGVLEIVDGKNAHRLELSAHELSEGSIEYWPSSKDVNFKLQVFTAQQSASESVRAVGIPLPEPAEPGPVKRPAPAESSSTPGSAPPPFVQPFARVSMETIPASASNRLWGKSPITTPPKLVHPGIPAAPPALRLQVKDQVTVDVKLSLDASGKIRRSQVLRRGDAPERLVELTLSAARHSSFVPARNGERKVGSEVVLHYHFAGEPVLADARLP